jgi:NAD-dependent dihydropyrimidine dehydrogenase PreA subunit
MTIVYISLVILLLVLIGGKLHRKKKGRNRLVHVIEKNCTRCRSCLKKCNHHVLDMIKDENGMHIEVISPDKCTGCGDCISVCRFNALGFVQRVEKKSKEHESF